MQVSFALGGVPWEWPGEACEGPWMGEKERERSGASNWQLFHSRTQAGPSLTGFAWQSRLHYRSICLPGPVAVGARPRVMDAKVGSAFTQERNPMTVGEAWVREVGVCVCVTPSYNIMSWGKIRRTSCLGRSWLKINGVLKQIRTGKVDVG